jgi:hypothetical protein
VKKFLLLIVVLSSCAAWAQKSLGPVIQTANVSSITSSSAMSGGNILDDGGNFIFDRGIVWSQSPGPTFEQHSGICSNGQGTGTYTCVMTALSPGTQYFVRAYSRDFSGTFYGNQLTFTTNTLALADQTKIQLKASPNPFKDFVVINFDRTVSGEGEVFDLTGRSVKKVFINQQKEVRIDLKDLPSGLYFFQYSDPKLSATIKLVKQ